MEWIVMYEIPPTRGINRKTVVAKTKEEAVEFIQSLNSHRLNIINVFDSKDPDRMPDPFKERKFS